MSTATKSTPRVPATPWQLTRSTEVCRHPSSAFSAIRVPALDGLAVYHAEQLAAVYIRWAVAHPFSVVVAKFERVSNLLPRKSSIQQRIGHRSAVPTSLQTQTLAATCSLQSALHCERPLSKPRAPRRHCHSRSLTPRGPARTCLQPLTPSGAHAAPTFAAPAAAPAGCHRASC